MVRRSRRRRGRGQLWWDRDRRQGPLPRSATHRRRGVSSRLVVDAAQHAAEHYGADRFVIVADEHYHALQRGWASRVSSACSAYAAPPKPRATRAGAVAVPNSSCSWSRWLPPSRRPGARALDRLVRIGRRRRASGAASCVRRGSPGRHGPGARQRKCSAGTPRRSRPRYSFPARHGSTRPARTTPPVAAAAFQDLAYETQVENKERWVADSSAPLGADRLSARVDRAGGLAVPLPRQDGVLVHAAGRRADARPAQGREIERLLADLGRR